MRCCCKLVGRIVGSRQSNISIISPRMSSGNSDGVMFQLKIDPLTGNSDWLVIQQQEVEDDEISTSFPKKSMLATTSYLDMLNDTTRNRAYRLAIDSTLSKHSSPSPPPHVLDIGYIL